MKPVNEERLQKMLEYIRDYAMDEGVVFGMIDYVFHDPAAC